MRLKHVKCRSGQDEMAEAAIEMFIKAEVVERIDKVSPVKVGVNTEHLPKDCLANVERIPVGSHCFYQSNRQDQIAEQVRQIDLSGPLVSEHYHQVC